jgi:phage tail-like protein
MAVIDHNSYADGSKWPLAKFSFLVKLDSTQVSFQGVDGLESEISIIEYRGGDYALWSKTKRPGMISYSNVTLKKGMFKGDKVLHDWWKDFETNHLHSKRKSITIDLLNEAGSVCVSWRLTNAFVVKYTPSTMDAEADSEPAIEEMEIAYEKLDITIA